jgi:lipopolysaccharide/colanic/teichoic acid biosynthesis glycosyltransferase
LVRLMTWQNAVKRGVDLLGASVGALLLSPVMAVVAILVRWQLGSPVLFRQVRPGYRAKPITVVKFRTMRNAYDEQGALLPDHQRLTGFGSFLRSTSLDELPQLLNVLRGDLSLVGPRPLLTRYLGRYSARQARRHEVMPGITGWSQINGRNARSWDERLELDVWYVENWSLRLDLKILVRTVFKVLDRSGVTYPGGETYHEFQGQPEGAEPR